MVMGGFYSFRVYAPQEVVIPEHYVALDVGMNTFNCHVPDIEAFVERLRLENVRIDMMNHLDAPAEPGDVEVPQLPE
jgi:hypothetical protein